MVDFNPPIFFSAHSLWLWGLLVAIVLVSALTRGTIKVWVGAALHVALVYMLFFAARPTGATALIFLTMLSLLQWGLIRSLGGYVAIWALPTITLLAARLLPGVEMADLAILFGSWAPRLFAATGFLSDVPLPGLSYLAFRWLSGAYESHQTRSRPKLGEFLHYCFFTPIFQAGPITRFESFGAGARGDYERDVAVIIRACGRLVWGFAKFSPLASVFYQLTFTRRLLDGLPLGDLDVALGMVAYPAYLFLNFSGFVDMMIGLSALLGYSIDENFDRPYLARNMKNFWRSWHMSLTRLLKDSIYIPLVRLLNRNGVESRPITYLAGTTVVFAVMALWHGSTWNFMIFSALQVLALFGEELWRTFGAGRQDNPTLTGMWLGRVYVWSWISISFFFFENTPAQIEKIFLMWS